MNIETISNNNLEIKLNHINNQVIISKTNEFEIKLFNVDKHKRIKPDLSKVMQFLSAYGYS